MKILIGRLVLLAAIFVTWEALSGGLGAPVLNPIIFPPPSKIFRDLISYVSSPEFIDDAVSTLTATLSGLALSVAAGVALGLLLGSFNSAERVLAPFIAALNSLPRAAVAPLFVIWFGFGFLNKVMMAFFTAFFVIFYNVLGGYKSTDRDLQTVVMLMGGRKVDVIRHVILPSLATWVFTSLRVAIAFSLIGVVIAEFIGSYNGFGKRMVIAMGLFDTPRVYSILILLMIIGTSLVSLAEFIEKRIVKWK
jgi:NitT/TauT family transport system permease protein